MKDRRDRAAAMLSYIEGAMFRDSVKAEGMEVADWHYGIPETFPPKNVEWRPFGEFGTWGGSDLHFLFRCRVHGRSGKPLAVSLRTGDDDMWNLDNPQILMYLNGSLRATMDAGHQLAVLSDRCGDDETFELGFYAYSNKSDPLCTFRVSAFEPSKETIGLYFDMKNIMEAAELLHDDDIEYVSAYKALDNAMDALDTRSYELLNATIPEARRILASYMESQPESVPTVWAVGSTHIDVAWKWPIRQTEEKAVRSTLTALNLMGRYPSFRFLLTQPVLYEAVRKHRPDIFARIKERIKEGRWEAEGGMWLESDCSLTGGESLVRQIIHGKRYFTDVLGAPESEILWLPDAFGFNGNIPQLMKKSGLKYFMTTKINWSDTHRFPYDIFTWRGIDGSEVLAYFISTTDYDKERTSKDCYTSYNGMQDASEIKGTWQRFTDKSVTTDVLTCFGYGDGGGGTTYQMLENSERLAHSIAGCPRTIIRSAKEFFEHLDKSIDRSYLKKWVGELYFEYHRGIMTSIAEEKKWNRRIENLTHDAEAISIMAFIPYPAEEFDSIWKTIMLNQFHDILPGSAIDEVYETAFREYEEAAAKDEAIIRRSLGSLSGRDGAFLSVANASGHRRTTLVALDGKIDGYIGQKAYDGRCLCLAKDLPAYGIATIAKEAACEGDVLSGEASSFETPFYKVCIDADGTISSLYDKENDREVILSGAAGNRIVSYEDRPVKYDNWNLEDYHLRKPYQWSVVGGPKVIENGPVRAVVEIAFSSLSSRLVQRIAFHRHTRRIDFISSLDWDGDHQLLKAEFPVDVHAMSADYEIQFGSTARSTTNNTDWDRARFEVPAQRWCDISEPGYGVSLLTDSRYGYSIKENTMTVSLLKSGTYPAKKADKGHHDFTYSIYPHSGDWRTAGTVREAEDLVRGAYPFLSEKPISLSFASSDKDNVIIDTIKRSEDGSGIVIRAYEAHGERTKATIETEAKGCIYETDLLERNGIKLSEGGKVEREFHPYEVVTLLVKR